MYKNDGYVRRYSEGFKLKILAELSTGKYSKKKLAEIYGINRTTMNEWIKKYDRKDLMNTRVLVETQDETTRLRAGQCKIRVDKYFSLISLHGIREHITAFTPQGDI